MTPIYKNFSETPTRTGGDLVLTANNEDFMTDKIKNIAEKYNFDSAGAFGAEKNPMKKHQMRQEAKEKQGNFESRLSGMFDGIREAKNALLKATRYGLSSKTPALSKASQDAQKALDRLESVVGMLYRNEKAKK